MKKVILFIFVIVLLGACTRDPLTEATYEGINDLVSLPPPPPFHNYTVTYYPPGETTLNPPNIPLQTYNASCASFAESIVPPPLTAPATFQPITNLVTNIKQQINTTTNSMYTGIVGNSSFQSIVNITLTMFIVLYGIAIMVGLANPSPQDFIMRAVKVAVVIGLTNPTTGFAFFNNYVANFFNSATDYLIAQMTCAFNYNPSIPLAGGGNLSLTSFCIVPAGQPGAGTTNIGSGLLAVDASISVFFNMKFWRLPLGLFFTGWTSFNFMGSVFAFLLVFSVIIYLVAIMHGVFLYVVALVARSLLFSIAPLFFVLLLFNYTRDMFQGWLKQVINFSLQPVFVFAFIAFFNGIILQLFFGVLGGTPSPLICYCQLFQISVSGIIAAIISSVNMSSIFASALNSSGLSSIAPPAVMNLINSLLATIQSNIISTLTTAANNQYPPIIFNWWQLFSTNPPSPNGAQTLIDSSAYAPPGGAPSSLPPGPPGLPPSNKQLTVSFTSWASFFILIAISYLLYRMIDWAKTTASYLSEGLVNLPSGGDGFSTVATGVNKALTFGAGIAGKGIGMVARPLGLAGGGTKVSRRAFSASDSDDEG